MKLGKKLKGNRLDANWKLWESMYRTTVEYIFKTSLKHFRTINARKNRKCRKYSIKVIDLWCTISLAWKWYSPTEKKEKMVSLYFVAARPFFTESPLLLQSGYHQKMLRCALHSPDFFWTTIKAISDKTAWFGSFASLTTIQLTEFPSALIQKLLGHPVKY